MHAVVSYSMNSQIANKASTDFSTCKRRGAMWKILVPSLHGRKISLLWSDQKMTKKSVSEMMCFPLSFRWNYVYFTWKKHVLWACEDFCHTKLLSFSTWLLETHMHNPTRKLHLACSQLSFDSELWSCEYRQLKSIEASFVKPNIAAIYNQDSSWFAKVDKTAAFMCHYHPLMLILHCTNGEGSK